MADIGDAMDSGYQYLPVGGMTWSLGTSTNI